MTTPGTPDACPACGAASKQGLEFRHSVGPGPAARILGRLAVALGLATSVVAILCGHDSLGGYGTAAAALSGFLVFVVVEGIAARLPRSRRLRCAACGWQHDVVAS